MKKRRLKASILIAGKETQQRQSLHKKIAATGIDVIETDTGYMCLQLAAQYRAHKVGAVRLKGRKSMVEIFEIPY